MNMHLFTYITDFLAVLAIVINSIQFLLFSLVGIDYDPEYGGGLVAIVNVSCCLYTVAWVVLMEFFGKRPIHFERWPYFLPILVILTYFLESTFIIGLGINTFPGKQFLFFGISGVPAIYLATYIYRHDRFDIITRNSDFIMLICTLALGLNLPNMINGPASIGGSGGHQEISYGAAFCFSINWVNIITKNTTNRFPIFQSKLWRYISFALLFLQSIICILGGGRGGGVLMVLSFIVSIFVFSRQNFSKTMLLSVLAVALMIVVAVQSGLFEEGFGRTFNYLEGGKFSIERDMSDIERTALRVQSYRIIGESPFIGYGIWNGLKVAGYYMHNVFLDVLIAGGFIYLFIFLFIMKKVYKSAYNIITYDNKLVLLPWILYPSTLLLFSGYYLSNSYFWFFTIYCLLKRKDFYK